MAKTEFLVVFLVTLCIQFINIDTMAIERTCAYWWSLDYAFNCTTWSTPETACIYRGYECDSVIDCEDGSDEIDCAEEHAQQCIDDFIGKPFGKFNCIDGMCIPDYEECDGRRQCVDNSDEARCIF
ncbi:low-density lipoprotein receptor-like [Anneissia japonica]|uniref:low-density lipoprotein receptor-like n=1 Tax=Anneissia japonica TaxID=1529436 RepID=UPI0014256EE4|nr:low-density lipoprotein receptor-like [Anneissia japonica]